MQAVIYPVDDRAWVKKLSSTLLGVDHSSDGAYYVGFVVGGLDVGLDPNGHRHGKEGRREVDDIEKSLSSLLAAGAEALQGIRDVGGGKLIASVKDADGNIMGLMQSP
jgi:predicted enzyme related to lactoylglutathione lyase